MHLVRDVFVALAVGFSLFTILNMLQEKGAVHTATQIIFSFVICFIVTFVVGLIVEVWRYYRTPERPCPRCDYNDHNPHGWSYKCENHDRPRTHRYHCPGQY